jgi:hypothetical protein
MDKIASISRAGLLGNCRPARILLFNVMASKLLLYICIILLTLSTSIAQNGRVDKLYTKESVDQELKFLIRNLEKHHPLLYIYTSKQDFEKRRKAIFDHIRYPITLEEYHFLLSLTLSSLKHGHMLLEMDRPKSSAAQQRVLYQMQYEVVNQEVFIICTDTAHHGIIPGSKLLTINGSDVSDIIAQYQHTIFPDGFASRHNRLLLKIPEILEAELGSVDSIRMELMNDDQTYTYNTPSLRKLTSISFNSLQCLKSRSHEEFGVVYDIGTDNTPYFDTFLRKLNVSNPPAGNNLRFQDSTYRVAYWSIDRFILFNIFDPKAVVDVLNQKGTEHLIIDLRYNTGGNIYHALATNLFLADSSLSFMDKPLAKTRLRSALATINSLNNWGDYLLIPVQLPFLLYSISKIEKAGEWGYHHNSCLLTKKWIPPQKAYKGEIYVIINGGTYSAASSLANSLQQSGRATLFGTESGEAAWGGAAGTFKTVRLPNSKMKVTYGIFWMRNHLVDLQHLGRGVIPGYQVSNATIEEIQRGIDPQMQFILNHIREKAKKQ